MSILYLMQSIASCSRLVYNVSSCLDPSPLTLKEAKLITNVASRADIALSEENFLRVSTLQVVCAASFTRPICPRCRYIPPKRINLGYAAFANYKKSWNNKIPLSKRLVLYDALVVSVMMYNSGCWAVPKICIEKLDIVHRRHLREILNYRYLNIISNDNLYKRCGCEPLSVRVERSRWRMLGHVLRSSEDGPSFKSLEFAVNTLHLPGRRGRPQTNLFSLILNDLSRHDLSLNTLEDLKNLQGIASDRSRWRRMQVEMLNSHSEKD